MGFVLNCMSSCSPRNMSLGFDSGNNTNARNGSQLFGSTSLSLPPVGAGVSTVLDGIENPTKFIQERVEKLAFNQQILMAEVELKREKPLDLTLAQIQGNHIPNSDLLNLAYDQCRDVLVKDRDPFSFGTLFMTEAKQKPFWASWAWGRRLDELVDGINGTHTTHEDMDRWEQRTIDAFQGRPWDIYDAALADTVSKYPLDYLLFKDLIDGTRLDMTKRKFDDFDDLYLYKYYVGSTILLIFFQTMGVSSESRASLQSIYHAGIKYGVALAIIDSLRDVAGDAKTGRIYLPQDELKAAGLSDDDVFRGKVSGKWREFMRWQIKRAKALLDEGAEVINELDAEVRWALWSTTLIYRQELDVIESNGYDNLTRKPSVGKPKMLLTLIVAYAKSRGWL